MDTRDVSVRAGTSTADAGLDRNRVERREDVVSARDASTRVCLSAINEVKEREREREREIDREREEERARERERENRA